MARRLIDRKDDASLERSGGLRGGMTGPLDPGVSEAELDGARRLGERVARLAVKMKRASAP